ncbi:MAG: matrixin family metalloprotease, partial [Limisphaerales bacterium]
IRYHLSTEAWSAANRDRELDAIRDAFAIWQSVPGIRYQFEEASMVSGVQDVNSVDGINMVVWLPSNRMLDGGSIFFPSGVAGLTVLSGSTADEIIAEADIVLNRDLQWFTEYNPSRTAVNHVETVALHEIGHLLGLNHAAVGGSTMFWHISDAVGASSGLSSDELTGIRAVYGQTAGVTGRLLGSVTSGGVGVKGAVVVVEDSEGRLVGSAVSRIGGTYEVGGLAPGVYRVRVIPLDPGTLGRDSYLVRGEDLDVTTTNEFAGSAPEFLPLTVDGVTVKPGQDTTRALAVTAGAQPFRITETRRYLDPSGFSSGDDTIQLSPGQTNASVAVYVPNLQATEGTLRITGAGLTFGPTEFKPGSLRKLTRVQVPVSVAPDALPGVRSLFLTVNGHTAWANGFVEILPAFPDFNFDGLNDLFQRRYFSPFTRKEAAPASDPDGDGYSNVREERMGSDPTDKASVNYRIVSVKRWVDRTVITWESGIGQTYRIWSRVRLDGATWELRATGIRSAGELTEWTDTQPGTDQRFYRVENLP